MKKGVVLKLVVFALLLSLILVFIDRETVIRFGINMPEPTGEDEEKFRNIREQWWELIHSAAPGVDWRQIEAANRQQALAERTALRREYGNARITSEIFANGQLTGTWSERGGTNPVGSAIGVDYLPETNNLYVLGSGGSLWKGPLTGNNWSVLNDDIQFKNNLVRVIARPGGQSRILAVNGNRVVYSDNEGVDFVNSSGVTFPVAWGGNIIVSMVVLNNAARTVYCLARVWDDATWSPKLYLYSSVNYGTSFTKIYTFQCSDESRFSLHSPYNTALLYAVENQTVPGKLKLFSINGNTVLPGAEGTITESNTPCILRGQQTGNVLTLYTLLNKSKLYKSVDLGATWTFQNSLPDNSWDRLDVSISDAARVFYGSVNAYRSANSGLNWTLVNNWSEYYAQPATKLHADIMDLQQFKKADGTPFMIINNHGGVAVSYDNLVTTQNLSLTGLNNAQYYDVLTNPQATNQLFAGSQDQGFQRNTTASTPGLLGFTQVISGDYGYLCLSGTPKHLWTQYPGGAIYYYDNPVGSLSATWTIPGTEKPNYGWMLPIANVPDNSLNTVLMAGGNLNGGGGSYLARVTASNPPVSFSATQYNFDFRANSNNGTSGITAIDASKKDVGRLYVATEDGTFFYSATDGASWTKSASFSGPGPWYLYGSSIYSSRLTSNLLWYAGSGYSNSPVFKSVNGGQTFSAVNTGLPATLVHEIVANPSETMLFAATDAGPYVYIVAENRWYSMMGVTAPIQAYTSVEYIASTNTIRYGTFGRGIWDFQIAGALTFNGKVFLQGAYNASAGIMSNTLNTSGILQSAAPAQPYAAFGYGGTENVTGGYFAANPEVVDWVLIELHDELNPATTIAARAAFVKRDGQLVETDGINSFINFSGVPNGNYFVVIRHRNHLAIRSAAAVNFSTGAGNYDFTTAANRSYQNQLYASTVQMGNIWAMRGGNANANNNVKCNGPANDQDRIQNGKLNGSISLILTGQYAPEDVNMDGVIKANGPGNDLNFLINTVLGGLYSTIYSEQL